MRPGLAAALLFGVLAAPPVSAQSVAGTGAVFISNTGRAASVVSERAGKRAQSFTTGAHSAGYTLTSVEVVSPDPENDAFDVDICTTTGSGAPTSTCTRFSRPADFEPDTLAFTGSMTLTTETTYTVQVVGGGGGTVISLGTTSINREDQLTTDGWSIGNDLHYLNSGNWLTSVHSMRIALKGSLVGTGANTVPTASNASVTTNEDTAHTFAEEEFNFADSDAGDALASVTVVTLPAKGGLALDGTAMTADEVVPLADIGALAFTPEANRSGLEYASFTFRVSDGTDESALASMTVNVTPVNDEATGRPTISGTARVGQDLTAATSGIVDVDGLNNVRYDYQWIRVDDDGTSNATDIAGETAATYTAETADVGKKIKVKVSFIDQKGTPEELTSEAYPSSGTIEAGGGICGRTPTVRDVIVGKISGITDCANVTDTHLATIGTLVLSNKDLTALAAGDFAGLTSLGTLNLNKNELSTLPEYVFDPLSSLKKLTLNENALSTLPDGVFAALTDLKTLELKDNELSTLPDGVFAALTNLKR